MNPASALAQFYVIDAIEDDIWYRVLPGDDWAGVTAKAVARIGLQHLVGREIVLQASNGTLRTFSPAMLQLCPPTERKDDSETEQDLESIIDVAM
jgi:hypothetical protein